MCHSFCDVVRGKAMRASTTVAGGEVVSEDGACSRWQPAVINAINTPRAARSRLLALICAPAPDSRAPQSPANDRRGTATYLCSDSGIERPGRSAPAHDEPAGDDRGVTVHVRAHVLVAGGFHRVGSRDDRADELLLGHYLIVFGIDEARREQPVERGAVAPHEGTRPVLLEREQRPLHWRLRHCRLFPAPR